MKKMIDIFAAALVMLAAAGCEKSEALPNNPVKEKITLSASINNRATKTALGATENGKYPVLWSEDDAIAVIQGEKIFKFTISEGAGTVNGTFSLVETDGCGSAEEFEVDSEIKAFYPFEGVTLSDGNINYKVPSVQQYQTNLAGGASCSSFGNGASPMSAYSLNGSADILQFDNLFGAVKLQLKGAENEKLQSIELFSNAAVSGDASVSISGSKSIGLPTTPTTEQQKVALRKGSSDISLSSSTATEVLISLPSGTHTFSVYIITDKGAYYKKVSAGQEIKPGTILKMPEINLASFENKMSYVENGVIYGEGISLPAGENSEIIWAPVNCGYEPARGTNQGYPYGKLYQWGRKDGSGYDDGSTFRETIIQNFKNEKYQWDGTSEISPEADKFYAGQSGSTDWIILKNDNLWNNNAPDATTTKTQYDPCPEGWRVPTDAELKTLFDNNIRHSFATDNEPNDKHNGMKGVWFYGTTSETDGNKVFFPAAGYRNSYSSCVERSTNGNYWSSTVKDNDKAWYLNFYDMGIGPNIKMNARGRDCGQSIRCVKE